jgi:glucose-1-phosphatase
VRLQSDATRVRALLFDLGGVVIDIDFERAFRFWATRADCDPGALRQRFSFDRAYERHERGEMAATEYFTALRQSLDIRLPDDELISGWNDIYVGPVEGIAPVLTNASRLFPLYAFTNSNPTHQRVWSARFAEELRLFRSVFVSCDVGSRKPDAEAFVAIAGLMGFAPSEILFFDDTAENVDGARAIGMQAVLVESPVTVPNTLKGLGVTVDT